MYYFQGTPWTSEVNFRYQGRRHVEKRSEKSSQPAGEEGLAGLASCIWSWVCPAMFHLLSSSPKWVPIWQHSLKTCGTSTGHTETTLLSKEVTGSLAYSPVELASMKFCLKATNSPFPKSSTNQTNLCSLLISILRMSFSGQYSTRGKVGFRSGYSTTDNCHAIYLTVKNVIGIAKNCGFNWSYFCIW